jgi:hypothetical protein
MELRIMAICQNTQPVPSGKGGDAQRLLAKTLSTVNDMAVKLEWLQRAPRRAWLDSEIMVLEAFARTLSDADCGLAVVLDDIAAPHLSAT